MQTIYKLPPNTMIHTIKLYPIKHIRYTKVVDSYYYEIHIIEHVSHLPRISNRRILKVFKDVAVTVLPLSLSKESIDCLWAFTRIDTDRNLTGANVKCDIKTEIDYNPKNK